MAFVCEDSDRRLVEWTVPASVIFWHTQGSGAFARLAMRRLDCWYMNGILHRRRSYSPTGWS